MPYQLTSLRSFIWTTGGALGAAFLPFLASDFFALALTTLADFLATTFLAAVFLITAFFATNEY